MLWAEALHVRQANGGEFTSIEVPKSVRQLFVRPDAPFPVYLAGEDDKLEFFFHSLAAWDQGRTFSVVGAPRGQVQCVDFAGKRLVVRSADGGVVTVKEH